MAFLSKVYKNIIEKEKIGGLRIKRFRLFTISLILGLLFLFSIQSVFASEEYVEEPEWSEEEEAYLISNVRELQWIENAYMSVNYMLVNDIDGSETKHWDGGKGFDPIGEPDNPFTGTFDGDGHVVKNLYINRTKVEGVGTSVGLFDTTGEDAVIKDMGVIDVDVTGGNRVGALVGSNNGVITNAYSTGHVAVLGKDETEYDWQGEVGGLIGRNSGYVDSVYSATSVRGGLEVGGLVGVGGDIENSYSTGNVVGEESVGGLVGKSDGPVKMSYSSGSVTGENYVGGLVGNDKGYPYRITNSYSTADVSGDSYVGGLVGVAERVTKCYSAGNVTGDSYVGGLIGNGDTGKHSFWDIDASGQTTSGGEYEEGKPTFLMQSIDTYPDDYWSIALVEEYDDEIWFIDEGDDYPRLGWEYSPPEQFDLTIDIEGEGSTDPEEGPHTYKGGEEVTVKAVPNEGWKFVEWTGDLVSENKEISFTVKENMNLQANFEPMEFDFEVLEPVGEGNTNPNQGIYQYEYGTTVDPEAVPNEGWNFVEWLVDNNHFSQESSTSIVVENNTRLQAVFDIKEFDLDISIDGEGTIEPSTGTHSLEYGDEVTLTAIPAGGMEFEEWTGDVTGTEDEMTVTMDGNKSVTAVFEEEVEHYELSVDIIGDGTVNVNPDLNEYEEGTSVTLTAVPSDNFVFLDWSGDVNGMDKEITVVMDEDKEITATFEEEPYLPPDVEDEDEGLPWMWVGIGLAIAIVIIAGLLFAKKRTSKKSSWGLKR